MTSKACGEVAARIGPAMPSATSSAVAAIAQVPASFLRTDQRPRILKVLLADRLRGPERHRRKRPRGVVAGILWEAAGAHDEEVGNVPALQVAIHGTHLGIRTHHRPAAQMS